MILCVGEILADMIGTLSNGSFSYERKAGGAPFNVACAAKKFGARASFVGSVGEDTIGLFLENFASGCGLDGLYLRRDASRNTTLAFVELDENGERFFCFYRKHTADYVLPEIPSALFSEADIVHIGSLMLGEDCGKEYAKALALRAKNAGKLVSFDVNYRTDIFRDREEAVWAYKEILAVSDVVKFSEDEVEIFTKEYIKNELAEKLVCISLGGEGSEWHYRGKVGRVPTVKVKPVDTTGAGDAFYAGVLSRLDGVGREDWTEELFSSALRFGNVCGALNTLGRGAIDSLPTLAQIEEALKK
ncbi:MAG: carbohydrate kinase [Clostridia bacterium]|nr:carbohydrate kinase [Clostridia bacterium]